MKPSRISIALLVVSLLLVPAVFAQAPASESQSAASPAPAVSAAEVPRLIKFSGTLLEEQGQALKGPVGVTFALYSQQTGGAALWLETQNIKPDASGNYTVLLGANSAKGVPAEFFVSGEARWLGIQVEQQPEHERILLVSVPYALKAGDAETLGGLPASAFVTTGASGNPSNSGAGSVSTSASPGPGAQSQSSAVTTPKKAGATLQAATPCSSVTSDGTATVKSIALFTTACNVESSLMTQAFINGFPGVNVAGNNAGLLLNGTGTHQISVTGATSGRLGQDANGFFFASDTNGSNVRFLTNNGTLNERMRITSTGHAGIGTTTPSSLLHVQNGATTLGGSCISFIDALAGECNTNSCTALDALTDAPNGFGVFAAASGSGSRAVTAVAPGSTAVEAVGLLRVDIGNNWFRVEGPAATATPPLMLASFGGSGDFAIDSVNVTAGRFVVKDTTGNVGIGTATPGQKLDVSGNIRTNSCYLVNSTVVSGTCASDARLKTNIQPFSPVLDRLARLRPVHFNWRVTDYPERHFGATRSSGLIAQEVEKVFPELVTVDAQGFKQVNYTELPYLMLQAIRELKTENDRLQNQVQELRAVVTQTAAAQLRVERTAAEPSTPAERK